MINIDKNKDIDGYVSKLNDVTKNKIELLNGVGELIDHIISDIKNETNMIDEKIYKVSEMDNDTLHLINDKVKEFMSQLKQNLKKILVQQIYNTNNCHKTLRGGGLLTAKITSHNTNKIIVSQDFGGNTYSKNIMIIYVINDKF